MLIVASLRTRQLITSLDRCYFFVEAYYRCDNMRDVRRVTIIHALHANSISAAAGSTVDRWLQRLLRR
jgi:hypothetical protein